MNKTHIFTFIFSTSWPLTGLLLVPLVGFAQVSTEGLLRLEPPGSRWIFSDTIDGQTSDLVGTVAEGTTDINGVPTTLLELSDGNQFFFSTDAEGTKTHRLVQANVPFPGLGNVDITLTLNPPSTLLRAIAIEGETVESSGTATLDFPAGSGLPSQTAPYTSSNVFGSVEPITVPAGTFQARRVTVNLAVQGFPNQVFTLWFDNSAAQIGIARFTTDDGTTTETAELITSNLLDQPVALSASLLPTSRSVQTNSAATAFATIIAAGSETATDCRIAPAENISAAFSYQTTNPTTNEPTGDPDTPVDIQAGGFQTFVMSITPDSAFPPNDVELAFACTNSSFAPTITGVSTLLLSASDTAVPDIVALAAAATPGIAEIPGANGTGVFAVATVNVGAAATISASADDGGANLPVTLTACETDPATGTCINPTTPAPGPVTTNIDAGATPTFAFFVTGNGNVPFDPASNRIFVRFKDVGDVTRGSTSVAVRTQ